MKIKNKYVQFIYDLITLAWLDWKIIAYILSVSAIGKFLIGFIL